MIFDKEQNELVSGIRTRYCLASSAKFRGRGCCVLNETPLAVWNLLESQRLRFLVDAISDALLTEDEQARLFEVHEQVKVPNLLPNRAMRQDAIRG